MELFSKAYVTCLYDVQRISHRDRNLMESTALPKVAILVNTTYIEPTSIILSIQTKIIVSDMLW